MRQLFTLTFMGPELSGPYPGCTWNQMATKLLKIGINHYTVGIKKLWCSPVAVSDDRAFDLAILSGNYQSAQAMITKPMCHNNPGNYEKCSAECWLDSKLYEIEESTLRDQLVKVFN